MRTVVADRGLAIRVGGTEVPVNRRRFPDLVAGQKVVFGIRPDDLYEPGEHPPGRATHGIPAEVVAIEPLGAETLLVLEVEGAQGDVVARVSRDALARVGDRVDLQVDLAAVRFFDAQTTQAIPVRHASGRSVEAA